MGQLSRALLSEDELQAAQAALPQWTINQDGKLERTYSCADFMSAIAFINRLAAHAEALDHHPELFNVYDRVVIELTTHDAGGLTAYDVELARRCDEAFDAA